MTYYQDAVIDCTWTRAKYTSSGIALQGVDITFQMETPLELTFYDIRVLQYIVTSPRNITKKHHYIAHMCKSVGSTRFILCTQPLPPSSVIEKLLSDSFKFFLVLFNVALTVLRPHQLNVNSTVSLVVSESRSLITYHILLVTDLLVSGPADHWPLITGHLPADHWPLITYHWSLTCWSSDLLINDHWSLITDHLSLVTDLLVIDHWPLFVDCRGSRIQTLQFAHFMFLSQGLQGSVPVYTMLTTLLTTFN